MKSTDCVIGAYYKIYQRDGGIHYIVKPHRFGYKNGNHSLIGPTCSDGWFNREDETYTNDNWPITMASVNESAHLDQCIAAGKWVPFDETKLKTEYYDIY